MTKFLAMICAGFALAAAAADETPRLCNFDAKELAQRRGDSNAVKRARSDGDKVLKKPLVNLVENKKHLAASGDAHDFVSLSTYYWPDPAKSNGLPYIRKDGVRNPELDEYDDPKLGALCNNVRTLALAFHFTADEKYAARAVEQIRVWFFDEATRMNPNLQHAQFQPGKNTGTGTGIMDARNLTYVTDATHLLAGSKAYTPETDARLKAWFRDYFTWLTTSTNGKREAAASNNHGIWYDVQAVAIANCIGDTNAARKILEAAKTSRIAAQIEPDGSQPRELARTLPWQYSTYNLEALFLLAHLAEQAEVDLWNFRTDDGRSIRKALDYLIPFATGRTPWPKQDIKKPSFLRLGPLLRKAAVIWNEPAYEKAAGELLRN